MMKEFNMVIEFNKINILITKFKFCILIIIMANN